MEKISLDVPAMYGDHHVLAVRKLLEAMAGVETVYATSAFKSVSVTFDPAKTNQAEIERVLTENGYAPGVEPPVPVWQPDPQGGPRFVIASGLAQMTSFTMPELATTASGAPRPCPGFEFREFGPGGGHPGDR
ncbi:MAG: heavy-metal-associated domain-containing protein [Thermoflexales bacterium]|nr:heavy-metal-associated domain-containing protein [Thermoflexales bacterium]